MTIYFKENSEPRGDAPAAKPNPLSRFANRMGFLLFVALPLAANQPVS